MSIQAIETELKVQRILVKQMQEGVRLDVEHCEKSLQVLEDLKDDLYSKIRPKLHWEVIPLESKVTKDMVWKPREYTILKGEHNFVKKKKLKNGEYVPALSLYCEKSGMDIESIAGPFSRVVFEEPVLSKRIKLCNQLMRLGWSPSKRTEKGNPQLTVDGEPCPNLDRIGGDVGKNLVIWFKANHRQSQIQGWLDRVRTDGRIEAGCNAAATNTGRSRHFGVANIPKAADSVFFGKEMRAAFAASEGFQLCGWDACGLEARVAAHYTMPLDNGEYADLLMTGDPHQRTADALGITRSEGKQIGYALIYGAQAGKVQQILHCSKSRAQQVFDEFWQVNMALGKVRDKCIKMHDRKGYVPGIDGRKLFTRSSHSALNTLFQSAGAIIMSNALVGYDKVLRKMVQEGVDGAEKLVQVVFYHDETVTDCVLPDHHDHLIAGAKEAMQEAGKAVGFRMELDADVQFGANWGEIH